MKRPAKTQVSDKLCQAETESQQVRTRLEVSNFGAEVSYLQTGLLREQVGPTTHSSNLYRWHGATDVQIFICGTTCFH